MPRSPAQIVGRSRFAAAILIASALATVALGGYRVVSERDVLRGQVAASQSERQALNDKLDDAVIALERAAEDNARLQREVVELALASTPAEKRRILDAFEQERRAAEARRRTEDERRASDRRHRDADGGSTHPSPSPSRSRSPTPSPTRTPKPTPTTTPTSTTTPPSPTPLLCLPPPLPPICAPPVTPRARLA